MKYLPLVILYTLLLLNFQSKSQDVIEQYFDSNIQNDYILPVTINGDTSNIWQIGTPDKIIFSEAATIPNAIVTDTITFYPNNDSSSFTVHIQNMYGIIMAMQWMQKIDLDSAKDFGLIEYREQYGQDTLWHSVFNNPYIYNFYGYDEGNVMQNSDSTLGFSGLDTLWRNVWLCFDYNFYAEGLDIRFTLNSDSINNYNEGWMMDNFIVTQTFAHTMNETEQEEYLTVFPNVTKGRVNIHARKTDEFHLIEKIELFNSQGKLVQEFGQSPTKFFIDIDHHPKGSYVLKIQTTLKTESFQIILQ